MAGSHRERIRRKKHHRRPQEPSKEKSHPRKHFASKDLLCEEDCSSHRNSISEEDDAIKSDRNHHKHEQITKKTSETKPGKEKNPKERVNRKFTMGKVDVHCAENETEELRKRFDESLKNAMKQTNYHLVKGEISEGDDEEDAQASFQEKTLQQVLGSASRVLMHNDRTDACRVEIRMGISNAKANAHQTPPNMHFVAFMPHDGDERGGQIIGEVEESD